jgi:HK97 family phage portal protein
MIFSEIFNALNPPPAPQVAIPMRLQTEMISGWGQTTKSGQIVSAETAKTIATAYRCGNVLSDDIAIMPMQTYRNLSGQIERVAADGNIRNTAYLLEREPNRWMTPFIWKKTIILWLIYWGNAYIWAPPGPYQEFFILPASATYPVIDQDGNKWYSTIFPNFSQEYIPEVEMVHLMINSFNGLNGRSVLTYARETLGGQLGAHQTRDKIQGNGLNPTAAIYVNGELEKEAREKLRRVYLDAVSGPANAGGVAIFDNKITKFEAVTMNPTDAQFLENIAATDVDIANFYGVPLYKLNLGKQSYESNAQQDIDYLKTTLNPYLIQWEQAAWLKWLRAAEQPFSYFKFNRESVLQTDAKTRADYLEKMILSGQMTPNEARQVNDTSAYPGGDAHYLPANTGQILPDGSIKSGAPTPSVPAAPAAGK